MKRAIVHAPNTYYAIERNQLTGDMVYQFTHEVVRNAWVSVNPMSRRRAPSRDPLVRDFLRGGDYRSVRDRGGTIPTPEKPR